MAEVQVAKLANGDASGKSTVVSMKSTSAAAGQKRKAEDAGKEGDKKSGSRRSMKKTKR